MAYNPVEIALFKQKNLSLFLKKKMGNPGSGELRTTKLNAHGFHPRRFSSPNKP
jgi:hypothetical protein